MNYLVLRDVLQSLEPLATLVKILGFSSVRIPILLNSIAINNNSLLFLVLRLGSVRQNILFGQQFVKSRYMEVCKVCALERDISLFPHGDKTVIGERGVSLSGGQRARINLARAVYKEVFTYIICAIEISMIQT